MEILSGKVADYNERGELVVVCRYDNVERFINQKLGGSEVRVGIIDGRKASPEQVRKAHVLIGEISEFTGNSNSEVLIGLIIGASNKERKILAEDMKKCLKLKFVTSQMVSLYDDIFSFADVDMTTAKEFISFLIDFVVEWEIPTKKPLVEICEDIAKYVYTCLKYKRCAVCGGIAELHHVDCIGMGNNRSDIVHEGREVLPLCRVHHSETHTIGDGDFVKKYHLEAIKIDKQLCKVWEVKTK